MYCIYLDRSNRAGPPQRHFLWGPEGETIGSFADALKWFNYGQIDIDASGHLKVTVTNARAETVWQATLVPGATPSR